MESNSFTFPPRCQAATLPLSHSSGGSLLSPQSVGCSNVVEGTPRALVMSSVIIGDKRGDVLLKRWSVLELAAEVSLAQHSLTNELLVSTQSLFLQCVVRFLRLCEHH